MAVARVGPMPGKRSSSSALAVFTLTTPPSAARVGARAWASVARGCAAISIKTEDNATTITCMSASP